MSGGEEHSSLDSLRHNFCLEDLQQIGKQLLRWLKRQGKEGEDIAHELEKNPLNLAKCDSLEECFEIYKVFFKNTIPSLANSNEKMQKWPCFSKIETLRDLYSWFENNDKYKKNLKSLDTILWGVDEEYTLSIIEHSGKLKRNWVSMIERFSSGHADYLLGIFYIEEVHDFIKGYKLLLSADRKGYSEKTNTYIKENNLKRKYDQWKNIDVDYMKKYIAKCVNSTISLSMGNLVNIPKEHDSHKWTEEEQELAKFVVSCCLLRGNYREKSRHELADKLFWVKTEDDELVIGKPFYFQKYFIITIIGGTLPESMGYKRYYQERLRDLSEYYYPAKYLLDINETHPILDKILFRELKTSAKINNLLLNLFEF